MLRMRVLNRFLEFNESQAEILELITLAKQNISNHKMAWRYYQEAREKLISNSQTIKRKQYSTVQKQLIEVYSML